MNLTIILPFPTRKAQIPQHCQLLISNRANIKEPVARASLFSIQHYLTRESAFDPVYMLTCG